MDKLETIFEMQKSLNDYIIKSRNIDFSMEEWLQKDVLATLSELSEMLDEINWKWWKNKKEVNMDNLRNEIVDILHFFVSMCIFTGMDANELFSRYLDKNKENFDRQNGISQKKGYELENKWLSI